MTANKEQAIESPVRDSDIAAFRYKHALDSTTERVFAGSADSPEFIVEQRVVFEVFNFHAPEIGDLLFDVRGLKDALADRKLNFKMFEAPLEEPWVEHVRENGGVEIERMKSLTAADLERPGVAIFWPNGYTTVIDGNNRLVRRWDDGLRTFRMAVIVLDLKCEPYVCRPGDEERFVKRRADEDERGMITLGIKKFGYV